MEQGRVVILDALRAVAALSVCLYHFICTTTEYITDPTVLSVFSNGKYGVQMFFVISGFVIPMSMYKGSYSFKKMGTFLAKRLTRLEPPYMFSILLVLMLLASRSFLGMSNEHIQLSVKQIAAHFMYLIPFFDDLKWLNQVYWTLAVEFQYYLFMALIYLMLVSKRQVVRILAYLVFASGFFFENDDFLPHWLPVFLIGVVLFQRKFELIGWLEFIIVSCIIFLGLCYQQPMAIVAFVLFTFLSILFLTNKNVPILSYFGKSSYSIYLIHPIIGAAVINVLSHRFVLWYQKVGVISTGVAVTLLFSYLMYRFIERPSMNWSASFKYKDAGQ
jgi:peptidoglycan/LPS O-acetylase OafA/YrhL